MPLNFALLKIPFILSRAAVTYSSLTPPTLAPSTEEKQQAEGLERLFSMMIKWPPMIVKVAFAADALAETACIIFSNFPSALSSRVLATLTGSPFTSASIFAPSLSWAIGMVLALSGGAFRLWAFQTLGRHFTFELALLKNHELITKGPYAIVRHPSYTGLLALMWGTTVVIGSRGTWTREVVFADLIDAALGRGAGAWSTWSTWLRIFAGASIAGQLLTAAGMMARTKTEDRMLKREFGKRWDEWAKRTPWKLLPGLY